MKWFKEADRKRRVFAVVMTAVCVVMLTATLLSGCEGGGCASWARSCKTCQSEMSGGLERTVNVYSYDGKLIASYTGRIDVEDNESKVLFDLDGKRYIYYNAVVEVIEN